MRATLINFLENSPIYLACETAQSWGWGVLVVSADHRPALPATF